MERVEWSDVQGLVLSGYPRLTQSAYVLWRFRSGQISAAKQWLGALAGRLMRASASDSDDHGVDTPPTHIKALKSASRDNLRAVNIALTSRGLRQLAVDDSLLTMFSVEFLEGMAPKPGNDDAIPRRSNLLGDLGDSLPQEWDWGGWGNNSEIDGVLLLYAADESLLQSLLDDELSAMREAAEPLQTASEPRQTQLALRCQAYPDRKEHFGYTDGISQPIIEQSPLAEETHRHSDPTERIHFVKPGEFVLGYTNERRVRAVGTGNVDGLRRNGTYLVLRQLEQDVAAFNHFVADTAARLQWYANEVAAKLLGRCPAGYPLVPPAQGTPEAPDRNDFLYYFNDRFGLNCPIGAHIRRANPRDANKAPDPDTGLSLSKMHRIIRRGRMYGDRFDPANPADGGATGRGLMFLCLNADIAGQFEMIQHSWLNNRHFGDQHIGIDPFSHYAADGETVVIQHRPTSIVLERPKPFVRVRGGAYFFLPGLAAVRIMAKG